MKILLFGKNGQVGRELNRSLSPLGTLLTFGRDEVDLDKKDTISNIISKEKPDILVNAAAYTAVDCAETESKLAHRINAEAVEVMAKEILKQNAWLIHYSTDYVFDGKKQTPYTEEDLPSPLSEYGKSKLKGENFIRKINPKHMIFRTSWVFSSHGSNFAKTMLRLAKEKNELKVVNDQFGAPTSAELIADVTAIAISCIKNNIDEKELSGTYHLAASGKTSWYGFAKTVIKEAQAQGSKHILKLENINPISTEEYPTPATRPQNSRLDTAKISKTFEITLPNWKHHIARFAYQQSEKKT